jgi:hypothetical protein
VSEPKKDQIAAAAVTALEGVLTGAGYYTDLGLNVSRRRYKVQDVAQLRVPCATVWIGDSRPADTACTGSYRDRVDMLVEVFYRSETKETLDRDGIRVEADVRAAILLTDLLGLSGVVVRLDPADVKSDAQEFNDDRLGWKVIGFAVEYNWTASAP